MGVLVKSCISESGVVVEMLAHLANTHSKKLYKANHLLVAREHGGGYGTYGCSICLNKHFVTFV